jgi:ankyrin repeat protein
MMIREELQDRGARTMQALLNIKDLVLDTVGETTDDLADAFSDKVDAVKKKVGELGAIQLKDSDLEYVGTLNQLHAVTDDQILSSQPTLAAKALAELNKRGKCDEEYVLALLNQKSFDLDFTNDLGCTLLAVAARHNNVRVAERLLDLGASIDTPDALGRTALSQAASRGAEDAVRLLLSRGAKTEPGLKDRARSYDYEGVAKALEDHEKSRVHTRNALDLKLEDAQAFIRGEVAKREARQPAVEVTPIVSIVSLPAPAPKKAPAAAGAPQPVRTASVKVEAPRATAIARKAPAAAPAKATFLQRRRGVKLLEEASRPHPDLKLIAKLVAENACLARQNANGRTALHQLSAAGETAAVQLLLDAGADRRHKDRFGLTAAAIAGDAAAAWERAHPRAPGLSRWHKTADALEAPRKRAVAVQPVPAGTLQFDVLYRNALRTVANKFLATPGKLRDAFQQHAAPRLPFLRAKARPTGEIAARHP